MYKYLLFSLCILFVFCTSDHTAEKNPEDSAVAAPPTEAGAFQKNTPDSIRYLETGPDTARIALLKYYASRWKDACLPIPSANILLVNENSYTDPFYAYLLYQFDSLSIKEDTEYYEERSAEPNDDAELSACAWEQKFSNGLIYSSSNCEGGNNSLRTRCSNKKTLVYLIDILYHDHEHIWNSDSTTYELLEGGPGCEYHIEQNEEGFYDVFYYCGC